MSNLNGTLYVVATPIGNLEELTPRARETLAAADLIAAEDTRHSKTLLRSLAIETPLVSLHEHNETQSVDGLIERLRGGQSIALISDAGTPSISDPGFELVRAARENALDVRPISGACAVVAALSSAGLPTDRFVFEGFLPGRAAARRRRLADLADEARTLVVYESGRRLPAMIEDARNALGDSRRITIARELTKRFEESTQLELAAAGDWLAADSNRSRGEFVVCIAGAEPRTTDDAPVALDTLLTELLALTGTREAARIATRLLAVGRNQAYQRALAIATAPQE